MRKVSPAAQFFGCAVVCMIFSAIMPVMGVFSAAVMPAVYGVCLAATPNALMALSPLPGLLVTYLMWHSPAVPAIGLLLLPGIALAVCLRKKMSVTGTCVACTGTYVFIFTVAFAALAMYYCGSVSECIRAITDFVARYLSEVIARAQELGVAESAAYLTQISPEDYAAATVMLLPGTVIVLFEILSYAVSHLARLAIRIFPVPEELYPEERKISLPASAGVLFLLSFVVTVFSSTDMVYYTVQNLNTVLQPPLFVMGVRSLVNMLKNYGGRKFVSILFIIVIFILSPQAGIYSVCCAGMLLAFSERFTRRRPK